MKAICLTLVLTIFIGCAWYFQQHMQAVIAWIDHLGVLAPILFLIIYCIATLLLLPTMILTLAGGALFGPYAGTLLNLLGATIGAGCAFLISRYLAYNWLERRKGERLSRLIHGVEKRGWQFVALLRLFPIVPFNLVNYGLGITRISFRVYIITTFIFLIPAEIIYTYCGYAGVDILSDPGQFYKNAGVIILIITIAALIFIKLIKLRNSRKKFQE